MKHGTPTLVLIVAITLAVTGCKLLTSPPKPDDSPEKWEKNIAAFEAADRTNPPPTGLILCIGSSSMRKWHPTIRRDLAPLTLIPRGFGGSTMNDVLYFADRVVLPYRPRAILLYEGDNDINKGVSPEAVRDTFLVLTRKVHAQLPDTRFYVIAIKPSPKRWEIWPEMERANSLLKAACDADNRLEFIDVASAMLNEAGQPRPEIFVDDELHLNRQGYEIWTQVVRPVLMRRERAADRTYHIPLIDLSQDTWRQVVVDREPGQYLGHPTTVLLEDNKTMICVYPKGHGKGAIVMKRSTDAGLTWSERLPTPDNWATSKEVPTIHRVVDAEGKKRLILWSGLYPARLAVSEDDGHTWTPLKPVGDWGGIVVMACVVPLTTGPGHYLAMFHDDGRFFTKDGKRTDTRTLYKTFSTDGGLTWSFPEKVWQGSDIFLCEPGCIRSPDGKQLAVLLRENTRTRNSHVIFSDDEGQTWTEPRELPAALTGDRHTGKYAPDGRLFISFRDTTLESPTQGDWVGWVGTYQDIVEGREGQYRVRLMDNHHRWDCAYPGVEVLPDGTFVTTTYGHWIEGEQPFIVSVKFTLQELDTIARSAGE